MNVMGRVLQLFFDGQTRFQFVECDSPDIHGFGWCKRTAHPLITPYGKSKYRMYKKVDCEGYLPSDAAMTILRWMSLYKRKERHV